MEVNSIKVYRGDRNIINTMRIVTVIAYVVFLILIEVILRKLTILRIILMILTGAVSIFIFFIYIKRYFEIYKIEITEKSVKQVSGFFFIKESIMPLDAVQYSTVLISTFFTTIGLKGLNVDILFAYGGSMVIPFLSEKDSAELKNIIDRHINSSGISEITEEETESENDEISPENNIVEKAEKINIDIDIDISESKKEKSEDISDNKDTGDTDESDV